VLTSLYLGGHIASRKEGVVDCLTILLQSLSGALVENNINIPNLISLDRGYQSAELNKQLLSRGSQIIGTHKRSANFPFTYGRVPKTGQVCVMEEGATSMQWATCMPLGSTQPQKKLYALGFRSGLGNVALMSTSLVDIEPGTFSYITKKAKASVSDTSMTQENVYENFERNVQIVTMMQRTHDWFLCRSFRITGTGILDVLKAFQKLCQRYQAFECDSSVTCVFDKLGFQHEYLADTCPNESTLKKYTKSISFQLCWITLTFF
jgi:hypothetical protein